MSARGRACLCVVTGAGAGEGGGGGGMGWVNRDQGAAGGLREGLCAQRSWRAAEEAEGATCRRGLLDAGVGPSVAAQHNQQARLRSTGPGQVLIRASLITPPSRTCRLSTPWPHRHSLADARSWVSSPQQAMAMRDAGWLLGGTEGAMLIG